MMIHNNTRTSYGRGGAIKRHQKHIVDLVKIRSLTRYNYNFNRRPN